MGEVGWKMRLAESKIEHRTTPITVDGTDAV